MSDLMLYGILNMPFEMAMNDIQSRFQFYKTVQRLLEKDIKQQYEIEALHQILKYEGVEVSQDYLDECVAELRKAQEK